MRDYPDGLEPPETTPTSRARVGDIARLAKVSTATVDRVLNQRPGVRDATAQKVLKAAAELDYLPDSNLYAALAAQPMRLTFLLPDGSNRFIRMLGDTVGYSQEHVTPFNVKSRVELFESFNPHQLAATLFAWASVATASPSWRSSIRPCVRPSARWPTRACRRSR